MRWRGCEVSRSKEKDFFFFNGCAIRGGRVFLVDSELWLQTDWILNSCLQNARRGLPHIVQTQAVNKETCVGGKAAFLLQSQAWQL